MASLDVSREYLRVSQVRGDEKEERPRRKTNKRDGEMEKEERGSTNSRTK